MDSGEEILTCPATHWQAWLRDSQDYFLPPALRAQYETQARFYTDQSPPFWNERRDARGDELQAALTELGAWLDETDCELLLRRWDAELFFWYVLKFQFAWLFVLSRPPATPMPAEMDFVWRKYFLLQPQEGWVYWTAVAGQHVQTLGEYPPWGMCLPREMSGGQDFPALLPKDR